MWTRKQALIWYRGEFWEAMIRCPVRSEAARYALPHNAKQSGPWANRIHQRLALLFEERIEWREETA